MIKYTWILISILLFAGCNQTETPQILPTLAEPEAIATGLVLTENAPPVGFETVSFPEIDANLEALSGWRYEMFFSFNGVFAQTPRETDASAEASITYNQVGSQRRVVATLDNDLESSDRISQFEGVRLGPDTFLVRNELCSSNTLDSELLADLSAGDLLGGVEAAISVARKERINGQDVWLYSFLAEDLVLPNVQLTDTGRILSVTGELWVAPEHDVVIRYILMMEVENALILEQALPISGTINMQYNLYDIGVVPNISVPNGC